MSFKDCIDTAVSTGRVSEKRAAEAKAAYDKKITEDLAQGFDPATADLRAAKAATEELTTAKGIRRWQKLKDIQAAHGITQRLTNAKNPADELLSIMQTVEDDYAFVQSVALSYLDNMLLKYKPGIGTTGRTDGLADIVKAAFGKGGSAEAKADAKALQDMYRTLIQWANRHGASIGDNPKNLLPQTHDAVRVAQVREFKLPNGQRTNDWVEDHLRPGVVDWEIMRLHGKLIPESGRRAALLEMFDGIVSDGKIRDKYLMEGGAGNLATRLGRDRFLHYAGPEAWLEMQGKYGAGNLFQQTIGMVDHLAKEISMLKTFGASPGTMKEFAGRLAENQAAKRAQASGKNVQSAVKYAQRNVEVFKDMFDIHDRRVVTADGNWAVQTFSGLRTVAVGAKLGGALIPSFFGDLANAKVMNLLYGMPQMGVLRRYFGEVAAGRVGKEEAISLGIVFEDAIGLATARLRYFGAMDGPQAARVFSDQVYRIGLAAQHTQIARNAVGKQFLNFLHSTKKLSFDSHPLAAAMLESEITKKDWDVMRAFGSRDIRGGKFLVPLDMYKVGSKTEKAVAEKFGNLLQSYIRTAVPDVNLRSRRAAGANIDPNSALGQINRTMLSLLTFPMALHFNQLQRIAKLPNLRDKLVFGSAYVGMLTVAGAFITQAKALASGQQLYDMSPFNAAGEINLDFYGRAFINGGSLGILGDVVMNSININNSSYRPGDPTTELLKSAHALTVDNLIDYAQGRPVEIGADAFNFGDQLMPKFWHTKLLIERAIMDDLQQQVDPEGYSRALKFEREHAEGMWWGTGEDPQALRPETAIGG